MKINVSLDDDLIKRIDNYASSNYMSRSGLISFSCNQYLNSVEFMGVIKDVSISLRKMADTNLVDEDTMHQLEDFERICKMLGSK